MRRALALALAAALAAGGAAAQRRMLEAPEAEAFAAVGRLNVSGARFCTATLVAPDAAATAAHCLHHPLTQARAPLASIRFVAFYGPGFEPVVRQAVAVAVAPGYAPGRRALEDVGRDLAVIALDAPVEGAPPVAVGAYAGGPVAIVSYARHRPHAPSLTPACPARGVGGGALALDCPAVFGESGAPVFAGEGAERRLVAVVSAADGRGRALAALASPAVEALRAALGHLDDDAADSQIPEVRAPQSGSGR